MRETHTWIPACAGMTMLWWSAVAQAEPAFSRLYKQQYGYTPSCNACHKDGGGTPNNSYGLQFKEAGESLAAFKQIATLDGDGDGAKNADEAAAKSNPGDAKSTPANKGTWLDTASLIPREVQALFPGVREYLPRDAVLTDADIARAKMLGAVLGKADENTIYIPLTDKKPAGTALIFPAQYKGKDFFLLLATDRQLNITSVAPLNATQVPEAKKSKVYAGFKGVALDKLPAASGSGVDAAIGEAVKKAGTLIYVRLKNA
ncbi:MAG: hypothetical protein V4709_11455 [Pseudomonadota bacterium]